MGDFLLSINNDREVALERIESALRFYPDMQAERFAAPGISLVTASPDNPALWSMARSQDGSVLVSITGRIALEEAQWRIADQSAGTGGLAGKYLLEAYRRKGVEGLCNLNGHFAIVLIDQRNGCLHLANDRWGLMPVYRHQAGGSLAFSSHPDALAMASGASNDFDLTSMAEFVLTAKISAPYSYYRSIRMLPPANLTTLTLAPGKTPVEKAAPYFQHEYRIERNGGAAALGEYLAEGFKQSVRQRTNPRLGKSALALSGGLDSRVLLCSSSETERPVTFSCYDEENVEFGIARTIARAAGAEFVPLRRSFDYYADSAAMGARISGGMGCIASNHFLGFRDQLREMGVSNLLTGCYCDYLFKGLALNKKSNPLTTRERLAPFSDEYYANHYRASVPMTGAVRQRREEVFPMDLRKRYADGDTTAVEQRRIFPLCYEEDNAERTIPQRVMGWYVPIADSMLLDVHLRMPLSQKLNRTLFARAAEEICGTQVASIPDANTGARVNASMLSEALHLHCRTARRIVDRLLPRMSTPGSWPNWRFYANKSEKIQALWNQPNPEASDVFRAILGTSHYKSRIAEYTGPEFWMFMQLLTLKLWFDHRIK